MKKRQLSIILLIWLLSQQLFTAVWAMPNAVMDCTASNQQSACTVMVTEDMASSNTMVDHSEDPFSHHKSSMTCELCISACQASLIPNDLLALVKVVHFTAKAHPIDDLVDAFFNTLYRPPILA